MLSIGFADRKSSNLYENLTVQTKMAILSRRLILLAILLYQGELTQNNFGANLAFMPIFYTGPRCPG